VRTKYNRTQEKRITKELAETQILKFYLVCYYEDADDDDSCIDEIQTMNYDFAKGYIGHDNFKVFAVYEDGLMKEL
jgi:hypothetical protein